MATNDPIAVYAAKAREILRQLAAIECGELVTPDADRTRIALLSDAEAITELYDLHMADVWRTMPDKCLVAESKAHPFEEWQKEYAVWVTSNVIKYGYLQVFAWQPA